MDKDSSEAIEMRKLLFAVRSVMKLPPSLISDNEVAKLFVTLDENGNGEFFFFLQLARPQRPARAPPRRRAARARRRRRRRGGGRSPLPHDARRLWPRIARQKRTATGT